LRVYGSQEELNKTVDMIADLDSRGIVIRAFVEDVAVGDNAPYVGAVYEVGADGKKALSLRFLAEVGLGMMTGIDSQGLEKFMASLEAGKRHSPGRYVVYENGLASKDMSEGWYVTSITPETQSIETPKGIGVTKLRVPKNLCLK
jgi:hypothetical protein